MTSKLFSHIVLTLGAFMIMVSFAFGVSAASQPTWYDVVKLSYPNSIRAGQVVDIKWTVPSALRYDDTEVIVSLCHKEGCKNVATVSRFSVAKSSIKIARNFTGPGEFYLNYEHKLAENTYPTSYATKGHSFDVLPAFQLLAIKDVKAVFKSVYGRNPTASEYTYWVKRLKDKPEKEYFIGALKYNKEHKVKH